MTNMDKASLIAQDCFLKLLMVSEEIATQTLLLGFGYHLKGLG
jgi:hypothetical protein